MDCNSDTAIGLMKLATADPGLPHYTPSASYWMKTPSKLAGQQSNQLPITVDVIVIGSGITGAIVAKTILERHSKHRVTILEARDVCSGATGRNGGHLVAYGGAIYSGLKEALGRDMASRILAFTFDNVKKTKQLIQEYSSGEGYREVTRYRSFADEISYQEARSSVADFEKDNPTWTGLYRFVGKDEAETVYGIHNVAGICIFGAGALSPYRFVTAIYEHLLETYETSRFSLEANTPVQRLRHDSTTGLSHPYFVTTPRGTIRASQVVHCTNGYAGHLLPKLRGPMYPFRGCMTVQDLGNRLPNRGHCASWSLHHKPKMDYHSGRSALGTHYLQQDSISGFFYFGGQEEVVADVVTADDSQVPPNSVPYLRQTLLRLFGMAEQKTDNIVSAWAGIMGFTADGLPLVGQLLEDVTQRQGKGEWIAAGFNGMGMSMCVASGESIGRMVLGENVEGCIPGAFQVTSARLKESLTTQATIQKLTAMFSLETLEARL